MAVAELPEAVKAWQPLDEEMLRRRILGTDYPARTAEELLEKIEAAGAVGVAISLEDERWESWAVGGAVEAREMLLELSRKRRVLWGQAEGCHGRWVGVDSLALVLAAQEKTAKKSRFKWFAADARDMLSTRLAPFAIAELPPALLEPEMSPEEARRLVVEQALKLDAVQTMAALLAEVAWIKDAAMILEELRRARLVSTFGEDEIVWTEYVEQLRAMALRRERRAAATVDIAALQRHLLRWQRFVVKNNGRQTKDEIAGGMELVDRLEDVLDSP